MQRLSSRGRLIALLVIALLVRLLFIRSGGFSIDVGDFQGWATQLTRTPLASFYGGAGFADYPPGYLYVLWLVGHVYALLAPNGNGGLFVVLVKLPAILMDLFDAAVLYALVRRYASDAWALGAAAMFALNPAAIFVSSVWGQVDSVSGGLALLGIYLMARASDDDADASWFVVEAWLALAASILVKPQAAVLVPLFVAFIFGSREWLPSRIGRRALATAGGIAGGIALAIVAARPFHAGGNVIDLLFWLKGIYAAGYAGYSFNSVNAFNLWTVARPFWQSDAQPILFLSQYAWGVLLFVAATGLIVWRYLQARTQQSFVEASALLALGFFILMTRMHERYVFDALLFACAAIPLGRRYVVAAAAITVTLFANLLYSLQYLSIVTHNTPGQNSVDVWGFGDHALSFVNVAVFFVLAYVYLSVDPGEAPALPKIAWPAFPQRAEGEPAEGTVGMLWPLDYLLSIGIGLASFVLLFVNYWFPPDKIFDEIYFARAAENYLTRNYIYESTHPPVTKLLITLSTWMFGGMAHGDTSWGWRFLDVVAGALVVWLLYIFAKRVTGSTLFASIAAILLALDGQHFVQSRIATPEAFVALFSLTAIYAFYRFWIASQGRTVEPFDPGAFARTLGLRAAGVFAAVLVSIGAVLVRFPTEAFSTKVVLVVYMTTGFYLVYRLLLEARILKREARPHAADLWLAIFTIAAALTVTSKWYGVMVYGMAIVVLAVVTFQPVMRAFRSTYLNREATPYAWGTPFGFRLDVIVCAVLFALGTVYSLAYIPHFIGLKDLPQSAPRAYTVTDVVDMQVGAFEYHDHLVATHPYQSVWWQWPLDIRPVMYYAKYGGAGDHVTAGYIYSLPNPLIMWFGLLAVPFVGFLAYRERNKGYALIVLAYLAQWLPWIASPRIAWNYHFYVNIALICLCNAIALQWMWKRGWRIPTVAYVVAVAAAFVFFYPILAGVVTPMWAVQMRQWLHSWV